MEKTASTEIVVPESALGLYTEALAEMETSERDQAKEVIKTRLLEIQRMEACVEKAKRDLTKLLGKEVSEIAML